MRALCPFLCTCTAISHHPRRPICYASLPHLVSSPQRPPPSCLAFLRVVSVLRSSHPIRAEQDFLTFFRDDPWHVLGCQCACLGSSLLHTLLCAIMTMLHGYLPLERWPLCSRVTFVMRCLALQFSVFLSLRYTSDTGVLRK